MNANTDTEILRFARKILQENEEYFRYIGSEQISVRLNVV